MAKKKDCNIIEMNDKSFTIAERTREDSDVRMIPYAIKMFVEEVDNEEICRDPLIQRTDDQWTKKQKSKLIEAVLHNRPIGSIALAKGRAESKSYAVTSLVDGLQRTTALVDFYHDKYALDKKATPVICRCVDEEGNEEKLEIPIAGKKYSQLPDAIKSFFDKYRLNTYMHEGFSDEELDDIVFCMNNGKTPNAYQKIRFLLGSDNMRSLQPICDSVLWEDAKGCKAKNDSILCCIIRTLMIMTHYNYTNLGSATMTKFVDEEVFEQYVKTNTITNLKNLVDELADIRDSVSGEDAEKFDSVTIPHYIIALDEFNKNNKANKNFVNFLHDFWQSEYYDKFADACDAKGSGSGQYSSENVSERQYALYDFIDEYLDIADNDEDNDTDITEDNNGDDCIENNGHNDCEGERAGNDNSTVDEDEGLFDEESYDVGDMPTVSADCGQTGCDRPEEQEDTDYISGYKPISATA